MLKLSQLRLLVGHMLTLLGPARGDEKERNHYRADREPWRAWYQTAQWKRLRLRVFTRDLYTCQECGRIEGNTAKLVAHHAKPHRGNEALFSNEAGNIVTVCVACHDGPIKTRERRLDQL
jgi:5-methylcytosine-specific restriction endonuclease McrA